MGSPGGFLRAVQPPFRIEPQLGNVSENSVEPHPKVPWHIFQEDVAGSYFANNSPHFGPEVPWVFLSKFLPGD